MTNWFADDTYILEASYFSGHSVYIYTEGKDVVSNFTTVQLPQNSTPCHIGFQRPARLQS